MPRSSFGLAVSLIATAPLALVLLSGAVAGGSGLILAAIPGCRIVSSGNVGIVSLENRHLAWPLFAAAFLMAGAPSWAQEQADSEAFEEVIIQATHGRSPANEPIRVEVLVREEIEEKLMMTPGNVAMLVSETPGVLPQVTSPSLGAANIRMQGPQEARYTQLLS